MRDRLLGGVAWSMLAVGAVQISRVGVALVLARLLTPRDYGLAAMALVFSSLVLAISDLSLGAGLVQRREITEADRSTVFWTSAAIGLGLTLAGIGVSGPLASFYGEPNVRPLFMVLSLSFLLVSLQVTQASVLQREMRFKVINLRLAAGAALGGGVGIATAAAGGGAWALIAQQLTATVVSTAVLWSFSRWRPSLTFSTASLRDLSGFGLNIFGARLVDYLNRNVDNVLVGRFLGSASLGAYSVAYNIMILPLERLIVPIQDTLFPAYSRWQDDAGRLRSVWLRVLSVVAAVVAPAMLGLVVVAPDFVRVVLGARWHAVGPVLQVLAAVGLVQSLAMLGLRLLQAMDRTSVILRLALLECAVTVPAFALGLRWGIVGVAVCYGIATLPIQALLLRLTINALGMSPRDLVRAVAGPMEAAAAMALLCWLARTALLHTGASPALRLVAAIGVGGCSYPLLCLWRSPQVVAEVRGVLERRVADRRAGRVLSAADGTAVAYSEPGK
jgi:O-antigen/teichoic acid export membrane protein